MKIKSVEKEELMNMSYDDIAYIILKEKGKKMKISDLFKSVCENINLSDKEYEEKIGDFFTLLATEKRFIQLEKGYWDLRENHQVKIELKDVEEDSEEIETDDEIETEEKEDSFYDETKEQDDDEVDDDLKDLVIIDETEEAEI